MRRAGMYNTLINMAYMFQNIYPGEDDYKKEKEKLQQKWEDSMRLPRKKKKHIRKQILSDWSFNESCKVHFTF